MNLQHVNVKVFLAGKLTIDTDRVIEVFHRWVAEQSMDELLIDVADYRHVPAGPGVLLVGHEADYSLDNTSNRYGLRYNRKAPLDGSNTDRFRQAFHAAANACSMLEQEVPGLKFSRSEFEVTINDRALAPNTDETFNACQAEWPGLLQTVLGKSAIQTDFCRDPRSLFGAKVTAPSDVDFSGLLA